MSLVVIFGPPAVGKMTVGHAASQEERLRHKASTFRLAEKPTKRDLESLRRHLLDADSRYRLNSAGE